MITTYILSFFTGYLGILLGFRFALDRVQIARRRIANLHKDKILQVASIRELAKAAKVSKHKLKESELLVGRLETEVRTLEERVGSVKRADNRLVVLDERRLPEDHPWILSISGPGPASRSERRRRPRELDRHHAVPGLGGDRKARGTQGGDPLSGVARLQVGSAGREGPERSFAGGLAPGTLYRKGRRHRPAVPGDVCGPCYQVPEVTGRGGSSAPRW